MPKYNRKKLPTTLSAFTIISIVVFLVMVLIVENRIYFALVGCLITIGTISMMWFKNYQKLKQKSGHAFQHYKARLDTTQSVAERQSILNDMVELGILSGANLSGFNLADMCLAKADLRHANLAATKQTAVNLSNADLQEAHLNLANLRYATMPNINLRSANLQGATLDSSDLTGSDLRYANLRAASLQDADLSGSDLTGANLSYADLKYATLIDVNLKDTDLRHSLLPDGTIWTPETDMSPFLQGQQSSLLETFLQTGFQMPPDYIRQRINNSDNKDDA